MCTKHTGNQIVVGLAEENRSYQVKYDQLEELRLNLPFAVILERKEECLVLLSSPPPPRPALSALEACGQQRGPRPVREPGCGGERKARLCPASPECTGG